MGAIADLFRRLRATGPMLIRVATGDGIYDERVEPAPLKPMPLTETALAAQMGQRAEQAQEKGTRGPSRFATVCRQSCSHGAMGARSTMSGR